MPSCVSCFGCAAPMVAVLEPKDPMSAYVCKATSAGAALPLISFLQRPQPRGYEQNGDTIILPTLQHTRCTAFMDVLGTTRPQPSGQSQILDRPVPGTSDSGDAAFPVLLARQPCDRRGCTSAHGVSSPRRSCRGTIRCCAAETSRKRQVPLRERSRGRQCCTIASNEVSERWDGTRLQPRQQQNSARGLRVLTRRPLATLLSASDLPS